MPLTDQQLRQELQGYGETVPPITQRNREQLRARLEVLRTQPRTRATAASPSRTRPTAPASPSRAPAASSPSATRLPASPSRTRAAPSPSRTRATASPSRIPTPSSPSRARASAAANTSASRPSTRSKAANNLIELSDSEPDASASELMSRSTDAGVVGPNVQTRSIALRRNLDSPTSGSSLTMTNDVEQSIARHRREIKQLLDSARERNRATDISVLPSNSGQQHQDPNKTPVRPSSPSSSTKSRSRQHSEADDEKKHRSPKSNQKQSKDASAIQRVVRPIQAFWKKNNNLIKHILKALIVGSLLVTGVTLLIQKGGDLFPQRREINCTDDNVTACEGMEPLIAAVRKQLRVRTGEVECGFREKSDMLVKRSDVERFLDKKGLVFREGDAHRWHTLITYIVNKPITDIVIWNDADKNTTDVKEASKLSTQEAIRSLVCEARQGATHTLRNLGLLVLGSTGLLTLAWYLQRRSKEHDENEQNYEDYLDKALRLIHDQYEKHVLDPQTQPWLAISHIREKLIPEADRERLNAIWERVKKYISEKESRVHSTTQRIKNQESDVWQWIKSKTASPKKSPSESPKKVDIEEAYVYTTPEVGLTECLKLRNFFSPDNCADDAEIDQVVDSVQTRCANLKRIEHIGIHSVFLYLKFSSKEAAGEGYHLLNNWKYHGRDINVKYIRLNRYYDHFPEAREASSTK